MPKETTLQFGTGRFLRGFVDFFADQLAEGGDEASPGSIVMVQSTGEERVRQFAAQNHAYHLAVRGIEGDHPVDQVRKVHSVSRALVATNDWPEVEKLAETDDLHWVVSNVTEAGYVLEEEDAEAPSDSQHAPKSFPAKLLAVLMARFEKGAEPLSILPCELFEENALRLRELVLEQARRWKIGTERENWVASRCRWYNTLVDRIVTSPTDDDPLAREDPLMATAEPFALWVLQRIEPETPISEDRDLDPWTRHPAVQQVDDVEPFRLRKVRILNGAHTALAERAIPRGFKIVRDAVLDPEMGGWLRRLLFEEIVPVLEGRLQEPREFAEETLRRFANPHLDHRLADITLHHEKKIEIRLVPTMNEFRERFGTCPPLLTELLDNRQK